MHISDYLNIIEGELIRDGEFEVWDFCTSFCEKPFISFLGNPKYVNKLNPHISCIIVKKEMLNIIPDTITGIFVAEDPKKEFYVLHNHIVSEINKSKKKIDTVIGKGCIIHPTAVIAEENVIIKDNVFIGANTVINENTIIYNNVIIHENCVIGGKSFNFIKTIEGNMIGMIDAGYVEIEDDVEIFPLTHIAAAPLPTDVTRLKKGCKIDALVHIGHGTVVGERTEIPAGAQIGGNCVIGNDAWIGVNATVANRIIVEDNVRVSLGSVVTKNVNKGKTVSGNFAVDHEHFINELREFNRKYND